MKALVYTGNRNLTLLQGYSKPKVEKDHVLIKISKTAICGTDVHKFGDPEDKIEKINGDIAISGHEATGWILELGSNVEEFALGQRVLVAGVFGCNTCPQCKEGFNTGCENGVSGLHWNNHGCNAEYISIPASNVIPLPDKVSFDTAAVLTCAGGTAMTIMQETGLQKNQKLAIVGLGPVGLSLLILAKSIGVQVAGVEISQARIKMAKELGLDLVVDPTEEDPILAIRRWSSNNGCEIVAECVGKTDTQLQSLEMVANRGKIAYAGLSNDKVPLTILQSIIGKGGLTLIGIAATPIVYMKELVSLTAEKKLPFSKLITHHFKLENALEALILMEKGTSGKIIFDVADNL